MKVKNELRIKLMQKNYDIMVRFPRYIGRNNKLRCIIGNGFYYNFIPSCTLSLLCPLGPKGFGVVSALLNLKGLI